MIRFLGRLRIMIYSLVIITKREVSGEIVGMIAQGNLYK
jgi:hypothetical protein